MNKMTSRQKTIIGFLSIIACILLIAVGYVGRQTYQLWAGQPLGPRLKKSAWELPATWTASPGAPVSYSQGTRAPTLSLETPTSPARCGGPLIMNILAVGTDSRSDSYQYGLADVIRLVRVDFVTPSVSVLEFPRDLYVEIPEIADNINYDHGLLNQSYLYGSPGEPFHYWDDPSAGPGLLALTLNKNFGADVDHYAAVNMRTFVKVVDAVDGIDVNVKDIATANNTGLRLGKHHLDGTEALKVARNRKNGMYERVSNQNFILCALRKKLISPNVITQVPELINSFKDNILTDFTPEQLSQLACLGTQMPTGNITFASFPQELLKEKRFYDDPQYPKGIYITDADFKVLSNYVQLFQAGQWPEKSTSISTSETPEPEVSFCE